MMILYGVFSVSIPKLHWLLFIQCKRVIWQLKKFSSLEFDWTQLASKVTIIKFFYENRKVENPLISTTFNRCTDQASLALIVTPEKNFCSIPYLCYPKDCNLGTISNCTKITILQTWKYISSLKKLHLHIITKTWVQSITFTSKKLRETEQGCWRNWNFTSVGFYMHNLHQNFIETPCKPHIFNKSGLQYENKCSHWLNCFAAFLNGKYVSTLHFSRKLYLKCYQESVEQCDDRPGLIAFETLTRTIASGEADETRKIGALCSKGVIPHRWVYAHENGHGYTWTRRVSERATASLQPTKQFGFKYSEGLWSLMKWAGSEIGTICSISNPKTGLIMRLKQAGWKVVATICMMPAVKQL